ncbi:hypothetical protein KY289_024091, partial [Solanum tuberosum]
VDFAGSEEGLVVCDGDPVVQTSDLGGFTGKRIGKGKGKTLGFRLLDGGSFGKENKNGVRVFLVAGASPNSEVVTAGKGKGMRDS